MINKSKALSVKNQDILTFYSLYFLKTKMCVIFLLFILGTLCLTVEGAIAAEGNFGEKKYFDKSYFPSELSNNGVLSRSLLSCASECLQQQCANMIYDQGSRDCFINGGYLSFPTGTVFQDKTPNFVIFVEFQQGSWGIGTQPTTPPVVSCSSNADCLSHFSTNSVCTSGSCVCSLCYTYTHPACTLATCSKYSGVFTVYPAHGLINNCNKIIKPSSLKQCEEACITETDFVCRSIDYRPFDSTCQLSSDNKCTAPEKFTSISDWAHYHRNCLD